jgi:hypothetical protein
VSMEVFVQGLIAQAKATGMCQTLEEEETLKRELEAEFRSVRGGRAGRAKLYPGPVTTTAEKQLFMEVLGSFRGAVNWLQVTRAYNKAVLERIQKGEGALFTLSNEAFLQRFSNECGGDLAEQRCRAIADALQKGSGSAQVQQAGGSGSAQVQQAGGSGSAQVQQAGGSGSAQVQQAGGPGSAQVQQAGGINVGGTTAAAASGSAAPAAAAPRRAALSAHPLMQAANRRPAQVQAGQAQSSGKGGKGVIKTCKFCLLKTGVKVPLAGHACPNKKKLSEDAAKSARNLAEGRKQWSEKDKALWEACPNL